MEVFTSVFSGIQNTGSLWRPTCSNLCLPLDWKEPRPYSTLSRTLSGARALRCTAAARAARLAGRALAAGGARARRVPPLCAALRAVVCQQVVQALLKLLRHWCKPVRLSSETAADTGSHTGCGRCTQSLSPEAAHTGAATR